MTTRVLFFGRPADRLGPGIEVEVPPGGCTVAELRARLIARGEAFAEALDRPDVRASVDVRIVDDSAPVRPGQEVAFFSPFSGG
jgi:molybdopterin synthase sulfur carrier subunit